jgi:TonB family protein
MNRQRKSPNNPPFEGEAQTACSSLSRYFLETGFAEKPIWAGLYESLRDAMFPQKLPPLELTSTPIAAVNRTGGKTNPWAVGTAALANGGLLAILMLMGLGRIGNIPKAPAGSDVHLKDFTLFAPPAERAAGGGGGGGSNELTDPIMGRTPRQQITPIVPPQIPVLQNPILAIDSAIAVQPQIKLPDNPSLPTIGVQRSPNVTLASNGPGARVGLGTGTNRGDGPGSGIGYGPGSDRGVGDSVYMAGVGGVSNPIPLVTPEAEFSDEARQHKYQGVCMIAVIVDAQGMPRNPRVVRSLGMGLDQKALEAVERYRFKPAMKNGKPVAAAISVLVNFRLY